VLFVNDFFHFLLYYRYLLRKNIVIMGGLWYALNIIGIGMTYCVGKAVWDTMQQEKGGGYHHH